jgi:arsenate reductase
MAEAFFNQYATGIDCAESAGIKPGTLNPYVVRAMEEIGINISGNSTKGVFELYKAGRTLSHVIAVCDEATQQCPIFPGVSNIVSWSFPDPSSFIGSDEEIMTQVRIVRDAIEQKVKNFIDNPIKEKK